MSWTDERVALLSKLWADGLSASQIAAELGGVTRNAVIGKVHRLGLSGRAKPVSSGAKRAKRAAKSGTYTRTKSGTRNTRTTRGGALSLVSRTVVEDIPEPTSLKLDLVDLTDKTCRWPHGDPATSDFSFCGNTSKEDSPYCEYHSRLAFQPASDRRRDKRNTAARA